MEEAMFWSLVINNSANSVSPGLYVYIAPDADTCEAKALEYVRKNRGGIECPDYMKAYSDEEALSDWLEFTDGEEWIEWLPVVMLPKREVPVPLPGEISLDECIPSDEDLTTYLGMGKTV